MHRSRLVNSFILLLLLLVCCSTYVHRYVFLCIAEWYVYIVYTCIVYTYTDSCVLFDTLAVDRLARPPPRIWVMVIAITKPTTCKAGPNSPNNNNNTQMQSQQNAIFRICFLSFFHFFILRVIVFLFCLFLFLVFFLCLFCVCLLVDAFFLLLLLRRTNALHACASSCCHHVAIALTPRVAGHTLKAEQNTNMYVAKKRKN